MVDGNGGGATSQGDDSTSTRLAGFQKWAIRSDHANPPTLRLPAWLVLLYQLSTHVPLCHPLVFLTGRLTLCCTPGHNVYIQQMPGLESIRIREVSKTQHPDVTILPFPPAAVGPLCVAAPSPPSLCSYPACPPW